MSDIAALRDIVHIILDLFLLVAVANLIVPLKNALMSSTLARFSQFHDSQSRRDRERAINTEPKAGEL